MIRYIIGALLGAMGAYAYATSPRFQKQIAGKAKKTKALGDGFRLPLPATVVDLPMDLEDMAEIDSVICECMQTLADEYPDDATPNEVILAFQGCVASQFYGPQEVQWPPVAGDHPTIHQFWGIVGYRIRRLVLRGELASLCGPSIQPGAPSPGPQPGTGFQPGEVPSDAWGEPVSNNMMEEGTIGGSPGGRWRVYKDNVGKYQGLFYYKVWSKGSYYDGGPYQAQAAAKDAAIDHLLSLPVTPGISE